MMDYDGWVVMENGLSERWVVEGERYLHYGGAVLCSEANSRVDYVRFIVGA